MVLENFDALLEKYANLIINKGLEIKKGDFLNIRADIEMAPFIRIVTHQAYEAGAAKVIINWSDDILNRLAFEYVDEDLLSDTPQYQIDELQYIMDHKSKRLAFISRNPNALKGLDAKKVSNVTASRTKAFKHLNDRVHSNEVSWLVAAGAGQEWAKLVFPDKSEEAAVDELWDQIFKTTRVYAEDPIKAWDKHEATLNEKADYLNKEQFDALHYSGPGTDLTLGLPKNHIWVSAGSFNSEGDKFIANMPTEEVFTAPDYRRADGVITSSKPLAYAGNVIEDMTFTFKDGEVVEVTAKENEETIKNLVFDNEGSRSLGEVALVAHKSPISMSGITFFNTLFDENASNHLALGQAYPTCVDGGDKMSGDEVKAAGLNRSNVHVDFMVGNGEMDIDGIREDGTRVAIFRKGEWAF